MMHVPDTTRRVAKPDRAERIEGRTSRFVLLLLSLHAMTFVGPLACASPPSAPPLVLTVVNQLGRPVSALSSKTCAAPESAFVSLPDSSLQPGERRRFALPASCIDLVARDMRGRLVGQQRDLRMVQGAVWELRR